MKRIALLGMPNTGKSTLFNRLTGGAARVGNWPGITVELLSGKILLGSDIVEIIDLPGIYDLHGFSDDEQVVRHFLHDNVPDLALVILNATQIERQMSLLLQLKQLNMNIVVLLNMADEAKKFGITIDSKKMAELLDMPIFLLSGKYGTGYQEALQAITKALRYPTPGMAEATAQPAGAGRTHRVRDGARDETRRADSGTAAGEPHRKTRPRDAASLARPADLLRHHVPAVPGHLPARPAAAGLGGRSARLVARQRARSCAVPACRSGFPACCWTASTTASPPSPLSSPSSSCSSCSWRWWKTAAICRAPRS